MVKKAHTSNVGAILVHTKDIAIVRAIAAYRPMVPVFVACTDHADQREVVRTIESQAEQQRKQSEIRDTQTEIHVFYKDSRDAISIGE